MKQKTRIMLFSFLSNFFIRFGILFWLGGATAAIAKHPTVKAIGIALVLLDLAVSFYDSVIIFFIAKKDGSPIMRDFFQAMESDDPDAINDVARKWAVRPGEDNGMLVDEQDLDPDTTFEDIAEAFETSCHEHDPEGNGLMYLDAGMSDDFENAFEYKLRKRLTREDGRITDIYLKVVLDADEDSMKYSESIGSNEVETDFFTYIRNADVSRYITDKKYRALKVGARIY